MLLEHEEIVEAPSAISGPGGLVVVVAGGRVVVGGRVIGGRVTGVVVCGRLSESASRCGNSG